MIIGEVRPLPNAKHDKGQVLKIIEESAEVFSAWEKWMNNDFGTLDRSYDANPCYRHMIDECADVITATCNFLASFGIQDLRGIMANYEQRNMDRGRYEIQEQPWNR